MASIYFNYINLIVTRFLQIFESERERELVKLLHSPSTISINSFGSYIIESMLHEKQTQSHQLTKIFSYELPLLSVNSILNCGLQK